MRRLLLSLILIALPIIARADEVLGPAEYLKILVDSKLHYNMLSQPSKTPAALMTCPRRDERMRVVREGDGKKLIQWNVKLESLNLLNEGEVFYQAEKYDEAAAKFKAAIDMDPEFPSAYLFYGDVFLFGAKDPAAALAQYQKAIALDPTLPAPHFFASTAYTRLGRKAEAREQVIQALTFYPGYETLWKVAAQSPQGWGIKPVTRHKFEPPQGYLGAKTKDGIDIYGGTNGEWLGYAMCKAVWANEKKFEKRHSKDGWSTEEEHACVFNQLMSAYNATESKLIEQAKARGEKSPTIEMNDVVAGAPSARGPHVSGRDGASPRRLHHVRDRRPELSACDEHDDGRCAKAGRCVHSQIRHRGRGRKLVLPGE